MWPSDNLDPFVEIERTELGGVIKLLERAKSRPDWVEAGVNSAIEWLNQLMNS